MKVKVAISFHDAENFALIHKVGDLIDVSEERAQKLIDLGLVKKVVIKERQEAANAPEEAPVEAQPETPQEPEEVEEQEKVEKPVEEAPEEAEEAKKVERKTRSRRSRK